MKRYLLLALLLSFGSCVSVPKYKQAKNNLEGIKKEAAQLRKEIAELKKSNKTLLTDIAEANIKAKKNAEAAEIARKKTEDSLKLVKIEEEKKALRKEKSAQIVYRLKQHNINAQINEEDLKGLTLIFPEELYQAPSYVYKILNSAKDCDWLSQKEKETYYYLNYARVKPKEFCDKFIMPNFDRLGGADNPYLITLIDFMYSMKPLNALIPDKKAFESALCHAVESGKEGSFGHTRKKDGCRQYFSGECCDYGAYSPLEHIVRFLVDDTVTSLGHRYICLGHYTHVGIAYAPHNRSGENVVLDFTYNYNPVVHK